MTLSLTAAFADSVDITPSFGATLHPVAAEYAYTMLKPNQIADPSWSPDGTTILFTEHFRATYSIKALSVGATQVVNTLYANLNPLGDPVYSPDMFFILFAEQTMLPTPSLPHGRWRLRYMNADGSNVVTILDDGNANIHACWVAPTQIAFQWWHDGATPSTTWNIAMVDLAGQNRLELGPGEYPRTVVN